MPIFSTSCTIRCPDMAPTKGIFINYPLRNISSDQYSSSHLQISALAQTVCEVRRNIADPRINRIGTSAELLSENGVWWCQPARAAEVNKGTTEIPSQTLSPLASSTCKVATIPARVPSSRWILGAHRSTGRRPRQHALARSSFVENPRIQCTW